MGISASEVWICHFVEVGRYKDRKPCISVQALKMDDMARKEKGMSTAIKEGEKADVCRLRSEALNSDGDQGDPV